MSRGRVGNKYGSLTVLDDRGSMLFCRCICGRDGLYASAITKPTYKGRRQCASCAGRPCEICGKWIDAKPGQRAATCSEVCRKARASRRESERYLEVKNTEAWAATRQAYIRTLRAKRHDPYFDAEFRRAAAQRTAKYTAKINSDPAAKDAHLKQKRAAAAAWRVALLADPVRYAEFRQRCRDWYRNLSASDKYRIYCAPRKDRLCRGKP